RPPELIDVGAPQAIDQTHLFGRAVRWAHSPGVADEGGRGRWRPLAARAYAEATGARPGPVHLNLAFREPLLGEVGPLPEPRPGDSPWTWRAPAAPVADPVIDPVSDLQGRRGLVLAGPGSGPGEEVAAVAAALGWPVVAAPQAAVWRVPGATVPAADAFLREPTTAEALRPEVILHLGGPLASRVVGEWAAATGAGRPAGRGLAGAGRHRAGRRRLPGRADDGGGPAPRGDPPPRRAARLPGGGGVGGGHRRQPPRGRRAPPVGRSARRRGRRPRRR